MIATGSEHRYREDIAQFSGNPLPARRSPSGEPQVAASIDYCRPTGAGGDVRRIDPAVEPFGKTIPNQLDPLVVVAPAPDPRAAGERPILDAEEHLVHQHRNCQQGGHVKTFRVKFPGSSTIMAETQTHRAGGRNQTRQRRMSAHFMHVVHYRNGRRPTRAAVNRSRNTAYMHRRQNCRTVSGNRQGTHTQWRPSGKPLVAARRRIEALSRSVSPPALTRSIPASLKPPAKTVPAAEVSDCKGICACATKDHVAPDRAARSGFRRRSRDSCRRALSRESSPIGRGVQEPLLRIR